MKILCKYTSVSHFCNLTKIKLNHRWTKCIYVGGGKFKFTRAFPGAHIPPENEIPGLGTTDDRSKQILPVDGASTSVNHIRQLNKI